MKTLGINLNEIIYKTFLGFNIEFSMDEFEDFNNFEQSLDALAISTHHDGVTGTSPIDTVRDYSRIFKNAANQIIKTYSS